MKKRRTGYLLKSVTERLKQDTDHMLSEKGLTFSQSRLMFFLSQNGGRATQKEIEVFMEVSHPTVVGIVNRMEQNGFLSCHIDPLDRRNKIVSLTEKAMDAGNSMLESMRMQEQSMFRGFSEEDRRRFDDYLFRIYTNLSEKHMTKL